METFITARGFVEDPMFRQERERCLAGMDLRTIDPPIADVIEGFGSLSECFTLQSCFGHFLCAPSQDAHNLERVSTTAAGPLTYRIAYVAFCLESNARGRLMRDSLQRVPALDPEYVQFGSADWFWQRYRNSYVLQVEPVRFATRDQVVVEQPEALHIERVRDRFFAELRAVLHRHLASASRSR